MANFRRIFSRGVMNLDADKRLLDNGEYREALNISVTDSESSEQGAVQKALSNKQLTNLILGANPDEFGAFEDEFRDKLYWIVKSDSGCYLIEYDYPNQLAVFVLSDTRAVGERVFDVRDGFLFTGFFKTTSEDINKEMLLMTDNNMQPLCVNIERAKLYGENGFEKEDIFLIKKTPAYAPVIIPFLTPNQENYLEENFLSFLSQFKYLDGDYSAFSSLTNYQFFPKPFKLNYETNENVGMVNSFNALRISFNTGDKRVTDIRLLFKKVNSNVPFIIETFNKEKEGWGHNETRTFIFANGKNYIPLPERELFRQFDNVPLKAKSLTGIQNRPIFGFYTEGYNLVDNYGNKINVDYQLSLIHRSISGVPITYTRGEDNAPNDLITFDFTGIDLNINTRLSFYFNMTSDHNDGAYDQLLEYILPADFENVGELAVSADFISFVEDVMTANFLENYTFGDGMPDGGFTLDTYSGFEISASSTNSITIHAPFIVITLTADDTSETDYFSFTEESELNYYETISSASCKTNRPYQVGIIYLDEYWRAVTVLTDTENVINIGQEFSTSINKLKIDINSVAPTMAMYFKIVVQSPALAYHTLYFPRFYKDGIYRWFKLDGENLDKVAKNSTLIIKGDLDGALDSIIKVRVIDIVQQEKNFLRTDPDNDDEPTQESGLYMKIKPPIGVSIDSEDDAVVTREGFKNSSGDDFHMWIGGFSEDVSGIYVDIPITKGSKIDFDLKNTKGGSSGGYEEFIKSFIVSDDYDNIQDWYEAEVTTIAPFPNAESGWERGFLVPANNGASIELDPDGLLYFKVGNILNGNGQHKSRLYGSITLIKSDGLIIFETEPKELDAEIFYRTEQTFLVEDGYHMGNLQDQDATNPCQIELDFFNCFVQGNGAESYRIKDAFNKNFLNIDLQPSTTSVEEYKEQVRIADMTYGEEYIESSNVNGLNVFNLATSNYKLLDKKDGSIQRLETRDNEIIVFQEEAVSHVLYEADAVYTADGNPNLVSTNGVLGRQIIYQGYGGVSLNPESVSRDKDGRFRYTNVRKGIVNRLSRDGVEPIVRGMKDFFRDLFRNQPNAKMLGGYDPYFDHYVLSAGNEPVRVPQFGCESVLIKNNITDVFTYEFKLNNLGGDVIINYDITSGTATIQADFNGSTYVESGVTGMGNLTFERDSLVENIVTVTVTNVTDSISYTLTNSCPLGSELIIVEFIINGSEDEGLSITNRYKWGASSFYSDNDLFIEPPVTRVTEITGIEGVGQFPLNGAIVTIQSLKDSLSTGSFNISDCNRLGYLVSDDIYNEGNYEDLLDAANYLTVTESGEVGFSVINTANFVFSRTTGTEILYLIWDYTTRTPVISDDTASVAVGGTVEIDVLSNDEESEGVIVTIGSDPLYGMVTVNMDMTIDYTHDGSANYLDSFTYIATLNGCSSTGTVTISIGVPCNAGISASGGQGVYEAVIVLGDDIGTAGIIYNAQSVPDRYQIYYDDVLVADSKYVGDGLIDVPPPTYAGLLGLKSGLHIYNYNGVSFDDTGNIEPDFTVMQSDIADNITEPINGNGSLLFNKTTASPTTMLIRVFGVFSGTVWDLSNICPVLEEDLVEGEDKFVFGFFTELNKGNATTSINIFLGASPVYFYVNKTGLSHMTDLGWTSTKRFINDGTTFWELGEFGNIIDTGLI